MPGYSSRRFSFLPRFLTFNLIVLFAFSFFLIGKHEAFAQNSNNDQDTQTVNIDRGGKSFSTKILKENKDPKNNRPARAGSLLVQFRPGVGESEQNQINQIAGAKSVDRIYLDRTKRVNIGNGNISETLKAYESNPNVEYVTTDQIMSALSTPNDPNFSNQWGLAKVNAPGAWDYTTSSTSTRIAILDCGIFDETSIFIAPDGKPGHPDIRGRVVSRVNFTSSTTTDDFCNHGTHVAGIAAANTNNGIGGAGLGYNASLVNVKVLGDNGSGSFSWIINGILWAAGCDSSPCGQRRADIINMSLGATAPCDHLVQSAIDKAWSQGLVIVAAGGNSGANGAISPANCNNVIGVGASDNNDNKASFSNFGPGLDVAAPGVNILSTNYTGTYSSFSGTSMATPFVAGEAALIWNTSYNSDNSSIVNRIFQTAKSSALAGSIFGRIDALAAVTSSISITPTPSPSVTPTPSLTPTPGISITPTPIPSSSPTPSPTLIPSITPTPNPGTCQAPAIINSSDSNPNGAGVVTFSWNPVSGASTYRIQRESTVPGFWFTQTTTGSTSFTGNDLFNDPPWKVFIQSGTCTPVPGPATTFDP
jgi:thermitase